MLKINLKSLALMKDLYEVYELIKVRLADPKQNPATPSNKVEIDNKIFALIMKNINKASFLVITLIIGFIIISVITDAKGLWLQVRELLMQGKEALKPGAEPVLVVPTHKANIINRIDAFAMRIFNVFFTADNYVWLLNKIVFVSEIGLNAFIKFSTWTIEHWPAVLFFIITVPFAYYFNFLFIKNIKEAATKVFNECYKSLADNFGVLSSAVHKLGKTIGKSMTDTFGVFGKVICFPATATMWILTKTCTGLTYIITKIGSFVSGSYKRFKEALDKFGKWLDGFRGGSNPGEEGGVAPAPAPSNNPSGGGGPGSGGGPGGGPGSGGGPGGGPGSGGGSGSGGGPDGGAGQGSNVGWGGVNSGPSANTAETDVPSSAVASLMGAEADHSAEGSVCGSSPGCDTAKLVLESVDLPIEEIDPVFGATVRVIIIVACFIIAPHLHA